MALKTGLPILQLTKHAIGLGVPKRTNPVNLELRLAQEFIGDSVNFSGKNLLYRLDINKSINSSNKIGEGTEAIVYKIENSPYVLRIPLKRLAKLDMSKLNFNVSPQDRVNHVIATIEDCQIQKYIEGVCPQGRYFTWRDTDTTTAQKLAENELVKKGLEKLSIEKIKQYYLQLANANKLGMRHDYIGENSLINIKTGDLTAIDFCPGIDKKLFSSFAAQCANNNVLDTNGQKNMLIKGLIALLELLKEGKVSHSEVLLDSSCLSRYNKFPKINDTDFVEFMKNTVDNFNQNKSTETIETLIKTLKTYS